MSDRAEFDDKIGDQLQNILDIFARSVENPYIVVHTCVYIVFWDTFTCNDVVVVCKECVVQVYRIKHNHCLSCNPGKYKNEQDDCIRKNFKNLQTEYFIICST